jgi:hypothetical protein
MGISSESSAKCHLSHSFLFLFEDAEQFEKVFRTDHGESSFLYPESFSGLLRIRGLCTEKSSKEMPSLFNSEEISILGGV